MNILECLVCYEEYNSNNKLPLILKCNHTICKECVLKLSTDILV